MTRPLLDSEWTRCFLLLTFDKSIRNRMILTWITVDGGQVAGQAPPEGLSSLLSPLSWLIDCNFYVSITFKDQYQIL